MNEVWHSGELQRSAEPPVVARELHRHGELLHLPFDELGIEAEQFHRRAAAIQRARGAWPGHPPRSGRLPRR